MKNLLRTACTRLSPWILSLLSPWRGEASIGSRMTVAMGAVVLALTACGDDITEQINANVGAVETSKDLPECTKDIAGQTAFVAETHEFLGCDGKEWQTLSANTVSVGDNVCTSTSLSDGTGFEIFCNGQSIGTVRNGKDGAPGEKGEKGDTGADGTPGTNGTNGTNGKDGAPGTPGTNGTNGTNGKDGAGCKIQESTALTATIACGSETFTMDLTGYVELPAECDATQYEDCTGPMDNVDLSGVSQKGPFVIGTDITAYELENGRSLKQTGKTFGGKIEKADGTFDIRTVKLKSTFAYIVADGFYRNEVTGENSASAIKLRAFTNLQGRSSANINLVTHLEYDRISNLVIRKDYSVANAKIAAEREIFNAFHIDNSSFGAFAEDFNILEEGDGNAALLAISALLQGDRTEAQLTALLASLSVDLGDNGVWDNRKERAQVADWAMKKDLEGGLAKIRANVEGWKLSDSKAPAFEAPFRNFWMEELEVPACTEDIDGRLFATKVEYSSFYAKNDSAYSEGDSSLARLICDASGSKPAWRFATDIEKDTAALVRNLPADTAVAGKINTGRVYVKESGNWRRGTQLDLDLNASCVTKVKEHTTFSAVSTDTTWYICVDDGSKLDGYTVPTSWRKATETEADTAQFGIPESAADSIKQGHINRGRIFVYENDKWRRGSDNDLLLGKACLESIKKTIVQDTAGQYFTCTGEPKLLFDGVTVSTTWRASKADEADTLGWTAPTSTGDSVKTGNIDSTRYYVYEGGWRFGTYLDDDALLGPCTSNKHNKVAESSKGKWYKCIAGGSTLVGGKPVAREWRVATNYEIDTFLLPSTAEKGTYSEGPENGNLYYVMESYGWRPATDLENAGLEACTYMQRNNVKLTNAGEWYKCTNDVGTTIEGLKAEYTWRKASDAEADTAGINARKADLVGNYEKIILKGNLTRDSMNYYVYVKDNEWRRADTLEMDTYDTTAHKVWNDTSDGAFRQGLATKLYYVFEDSTKEWRLENSPLDHDPDLGGCTSKRSNSMNKGVRGELVHKTVGGNTEHYVCLNNLWSEADSARLDTEGYFCYEKEYAEGRRHNGVFYVCRSDTFRVASESEMWALQILRAWGYEPDALGVVCGPTDNGYELDLNYGRFICKDGYFEWDGQPKLFAEKFSGDELPKDGEGNRYEVVFIGTQAWIAQNLYTDIAESMTPDDMSHPDSIKKYGRLYPFDVAEQACADLSEFDDIRPFSFHLPTLEDWEILLSYETDKRIAGKAYKSKETWGRYAGEDKYLFGVVSAGFGLLENESPRTENFGFSASFWTSKTWSEGIGEPVTHTVYFALDGDVGVDYAWYSAPYQSVRCIGNLNIPPPPKNPNKY